MLPTPSSSLSSNSIQTLSPTLAPTMPTISPISFPTFPTLFPMATFPAFTLPPSFDKMAAGYIKKDKKKRKKHRRKPTKKIHNSEENNFDLDEKSEKTLPKVESRLPKFADEQNPSKTAEKDWMVPYYADDKKNQS
uniref:Uncharacterized protein n=2 Tax=Panagrolaimus sp. JU765 TaxID=591449 RepID=A0AC34QJ60_9BILA